LLLREMRMIRKTAIVLPISALLIFLSGCGDKFFDPTQIGRFRPVPAVNVILDSLGVAEETPSQWEQAEEPKPIDIMVLETDYTFGTGDTVRIAVFELLQEGIPFINDYTITETGKITIPQVGTVEAAGLTEAQLEEEIKQILSPSILKEPSVTVTLMNSQKRVFSILGNAVNRPGRYPIPRYDYRLNDALAMSQVATQFNVSYIYVVRRVTGKEPIEKPIEPRVTEPEKPEPLIIPEEDMLEIIAPRAEMLRPDNRLIITGAEMITDKELTELALPEGFESQQETGNGVEYIDEEPVDLKDAEESFGREIIDRPIVEEDTGRIEWIFQDGRWVPIRVDGTIRRAPATRDGLPKEQQAVAEKLPEEFDWDQLGAASVQQRVIKIPTDKLSGGDPRYNIVIRPGDTIHVPVDIIGEYFITGNTNNVGAVPMTGRPLTLKMAIAAAGGLGPLAWPKRVEVTRRIAKDKEETVMVDLDKIASGELPDFFIKPLDLINVGTHPTARWRAVLRNSFRATYGFGFVYDRNFADRDYGTRRPIPHIF